MILKVSGAIRRLMGWCPNATMAGTGRRYAALDGKVGAAGEGSREVMTGVLVDYVSPRFILLALLAFAWFFMLFVTCFLIPSLRPGFYTLASLSFMTYAAIHLYLDRKRAVIERFGDSVIIHRPHFRSLVLEGDSFRSIEVKKTYLPVPRWAFALLMLLMIAAIFFGMVQGGRVVDPNFAFQVLFAVGLVVFLFARLYRAFVNLQYPGYLRIALESGGYLHLYSGDPDSLAVLLGAPR
ncbi:DUF1673 family protein [Methanoculleus sp. UBA413]|jgi:hypothetical protein|uniref:DUF1673 family protein n=1 Tax=Methanoculleus sp. UBA413 TaxID=1915509 RepID=UPI002579EBB2|nr:DUF1673 family protein [Methanoculleus sp. UBA413]